MTRRLVAAFAATTCLSAAPAAAQEFFDLGTLILSGGLTPIAEERYGRAVSVVTAEDIEARGLATVQDALRALPGVSVSAAGGNSVDVRIRGGEANHTLILIDGIEAAGGDESYDLSALDTANIERIEVLRGPNSVVYGSNASSGVINIVTRRGEIGQGGTATLEAGGRNSGSVFVFSRDERGGISASAAYANDLGWDFSGEGGERDGTRRGTFILSGDYLVTDDLKLGFTLRSVREGFDFDDTDFFAQTAEDYVVDDPTEFSDRDEFTGAVFAELSSFDGRVTHRLSYEVTENEQSFNGSSPLLTDSEVLAYRLSVALDGNAVESAAHLLNLRIEQERDSSSASPTDAREALSYAVEYRGSFDNGFDLQAGLRFDDNEVFEDITVWTLAGSYRFGNGVRLHASAGTGSVNPTYFELYADAFGYTGNPALTPEGNRGFDIGVEVPILNDRGTLDVTYFDETLTDEIIEVSTGAGFSFANEDGESTRQGIEVTGRLQATEALSLRLGYTFLEAENPDGSVEIRRPRHEVLLGGTLDLAGGRGAISADIRHVAENFDTRFFGSGGTRPLPDYTVVNLAGRYDLTDSLSLTGRIENLLDTDYSDVWGYASRPFTATLGLEARF
ncbi:MAG: TonB-dependent receptor plug domain-containing protein [Roseicyclus sp.]